MEQENIILFMQHWFHNKHSDSNLFSLKVRYIFFTMLLELKFTTHLHLNLQNLQDLFIFQQQFNFVS